jgi:hypothetical protein
VPARCSCPTIELLDLHVCSRLAGALHGLTLAWPSMSSLRTHLHQYSLYFRKVEFIICGSQLM